MDRNFVAALAIVALVAGGALYLLDAGHERRLAEMHKQRDAATAAHEHQIAELRRQVKQVRQEVAARESAAAARLAEARVMTQKAAAERAEAQKAAAEARAMVERAAAERVAAADKAAREAVQRAAAAERAAAGRATILGPEELYKQALALEQEEKGGEAVKVYVRAARSGSGKAAFRLGEIYDKGIPGVSRDYAESLKWFNAARVLGEDVPIGKSR